MFDPDIEAPTPAIDPPEPPHPDALDTVSPGLTDESGLLPAYDAHEDEHEDGDESESAPTEVAAEEPTA